MEQNIVHKKVLLLVHTHPDKNKNWTLGTVTKQLMDRLYKVKANGGT